MIITSLIFDETLHMANHRDAVMLFCDSDKALELFNGCGDGLLNEIFPAIVPPTNGT